MPGGDPGLAATHNQASKVYRTSWVPAVAILVASLAAAAHFPPGLVAAGLAGAALAVLRLHPRKVIDIGWLDLLEALRFGLLLPGGLLRRERPGERAELEAAIAALWPPGAGGSGGGAFPCLSVRTGVDLALTKLALPKGSEVLFIPGVTIPAIVDIVESHGLRAVGVDPPSASELLTVDLEPHVTEATRMLVVTHLFGAIFDAGELIREGRRRGLFVIEDCAQAFVGAAPPAHGGGSWPRGFRGHAEADLALVSFGLMKTLTSLGGAVARARDPEFLEALRNLQAAYPPRRSTQFCGVAVKALLIKMLGSSCMWGIAAAVVALAGFDFDELIVRSVRGFPNRTSFRLRPSMPLLRLLLRRLKGQEVAAFEARPGRRSSSVAQRRSVASTVARHLAEGGVEVAANGCGGHRLSWWLLPVVDEDPKDLVRGLWARGFDATCSSTQLRAVPARPASAGADGSCARPPTSALSSRDLMRQIIYLPVTPGMSQRAAAGLAAAVLDVRQRRGSAAGGPAPRIAKDVVVGRARVALGLLALALALLAVPGTLVGALPPQRLVFTWAALALAAFAALVLAARRLAAAEGLRAGRDLLLALDRRPRPEGLAFWRAQPALGGRVDGAVLLTGATGFVGGGILFALLARAEELGVSRIVLLIRKRSGTPAEARLAELRANPAFREVSEAFGRLVTALEGDTAQRDFGWSDGLGAWPYAEPLRAVLHCAGDVRFDQPLQQAALSLISASLQVAQLAARWRAPRFVFVSTAFVHAVPAANYSALPERLVELRDFDPMELYRDAVSHGRWAEKAMRELGFPNTYTFAKAVAEHLILQACAAENVDVQIVRPSIVGPAWSAPVAGWAGDKPSTIVAGAVLLARRGLRVFRSSTHPCPAVPVDLVAGAVLGALVASTSGGHGRITHATVDASQATSVPSFRQLMESLFQVLALRGDLSLPEAGLLFRLLDWAEQDETAFWCLHLVANVLPNALLCLLCTAVAYVAQTFGVGADTWTSRSKAARMVGRYSPLPAQYAPFSSPSSAWLFQSRLRLPENWNPVEYSLLIHRAALAFAYQGPRVGPSAAKDPVGLDLDGLKFGEVQVVSARPLLADALLTFSMPGAPLYQCAAALVVRRVLRWMDLTVTVDGASLVSLLSLSAPLVLCPTHRSLLDFVILGVTCFQLRPLVPALQLPSVAADAEFSGLPFLGRVLTALGAFFVRRGGGAVQPDPALRAEVGRVFRRGRPLEVFLEGLRSRGRRHLRLRTGLLRALRDVAQRSVALVPVALSYELLPEDQSFYDELKGLPRPPLRTMGLLNWVLRGLRGDLPSYGGAHVRLGRARVMDAASDLRALLAEVQEELVSLTTVSTLHIRALAELLELPAPAVLEAVVACGISLRASRVSALSAGLGVAPPVLTDAQRWPLALEAATAMRQRLPRQWALWLVEPVGAKASAVKEGATSASGSWSAEPSGCAADKPDATAPALDINRVAATLVALLQTAEEAADKAATRIREGGIAAVTEEHLVQELLHGEDGRPGLPPPLARGAASIVAARLGGGPPPCAGYDVPQSMGATASEGAAGAAQAARPAPVLPLWPAQHRRAEQLASTEALDRWGFSDTRFSAQWVDGRPAVQVTSRRYEALGTQPLFQLWALFQRELGVAISVRETLPDLPLPEVPPPADGLVARLTSAVPAGRVHSDAEARLRAGTGHGLADIWRLRTRENRRVPDAVVRPETEEEVVAVLAAAAADGKRGFAVVPVGGRTNVTSATCCPSKVVDPRPFVALDMRGLSKVLWVNAEDGLAHVQAGITGSALKEALAAEGVTMGMEPDSMELSTLGGWIATRASGMKRARYGNIEDMIIETRVVTPQGVLWQRNGGFESAAPSSSAPEARSAFGRVSTNVALPSLVLGSEGCLGVVTSAVVRVRPLPEVVEYESVVFPDWEQGAAWMREVARLPAAARPASCRLMDSRQLQLSRAIREGRAHGPMRAALQQAVLRVRGINLNDAAAATLLFEGTRAEVTLQKKLIAQLVGRAGGIWGGASSGEAGYALTFAIAYLRDFGLDYRILSESLETMAPWSVIGQVWPAVVAAVCSEHRRLRLPGRPFLSCRMTQLYDEGGVLYMYLAVSTAGLAPARALEAFEHLEHSARKAILDAGGCLSHHHGVGKLRAGFLAGAQAPAFTAALRGLKAAVDPANVLAARNGAWSADAGEGAPLAEEPAHSPKGFGY